MRRIHAVVIGIAVVGLAAAGLAIAGQNGNSSIHLSGGFEVPVNDSQGQGQAIFHIASDGQSIDYKLIAANIENVVQAHIHCGTPGANGPVVVFLYPNTTGPALTPAQGAGRIDGVIASGTITPANVIPRAAGGACPGGVADLGDVIDLLQNGGGYVNVHTNAGGGDPGPGNLPGGEIRGNTP